MIVHAGSPYFEVLTVVAGVVLAWEWLRMVMGNRGWPGWLFVGVIYIGIPCFSLVWLRADHEIGRITVFWVFALVWAADSGAYIFGRLIGGPKFAPRISPNKTWAGFLGGVFCAACVGLAAAVLLEKESLVVWGAVSAVLGAIAELGDLLESKIKRYFDVKDTSKLIPGHGGLLDRVDGLLAASFATALIDWGVEGSIIEWL